MGSIIGYRIDCNGVGAGRGQRHIPAKIESSTPPPPGQRGSSEEITTSVENDIVEISLIKFKSK